MAGPEKLARAFESSPFDIQARRDALDLDKDAVKVKWAIPGGFGEIRKGKAIGKMLGGIAFDLFDQ